MGRSVSWITVDFEEEELTARGRDNAKLKAAATRNSNQTFLMAEVIFITTMDFSEGDRVWNALLLVPATSSAISSEDKWGRAWPTSLVAVFWKTVPQTERNRTIPIFCAINDQHL
jgi:predicted 3-demethylubiquinone-9 3-methyltransferase (glyoxalase superfamily)